jgi:hypothetical protein
MSSTSSSGQQPTTDHPPSTDHQDVDKTVVGPAYRGGAGLHVDEQDTRHAPEAASVGHFKLVERVGIGGFRDREALYLPLSFKNRAVP